MAGAMPSPPPTGPIPPEASPPKPTFPPDEFD